MSFTTLRPQIKTLLETITAIQEISLIPKAKFSGYPAATVTPSENSADYETTTENIRVYAFIVRLFYETKDSGIGEAIIALEAVVDSVLDKFDQEDYKGSTTRVIGIGLPSGYTFLNLFAHPSNWGELPEEALVMAEITVRIRISRDIT